MLTLSDDRRTARHPHDRAVVADHPTLGFEVVDLAAYQSIQLPCQRREIVRVEQITRLTCEQRVASAAHHAYERVVDLDERPVDLGDDLADGRVLDEVSIALLASPP